jgi:hypothetical protein
MIDQNEKAMKKVDRNKVADEWFEILNFDKSSFWVDLWIKF